MRRTDREITSIAEIESILKRGSILHLGMHDEEYPYVIAMHYGYEFIDDTVFLYLHCAKEGHKIDLLRKNNNVCVEIDTDMEIVSGEDIPCKYGSLYSSLIIRGKAQIIEDKAEKIHGLSVLMKNQTGRDFLIDEKMADMVTVIRITSDSYTAKARKGK